MVNLSRLHTDNFINEPITIRDHKINPTSREILLKFPTSTMWPNFNRQQIPTYDGSSHKLLSAFVWGKESVKAAAEVCLFLKTMSARSGQQVCVRATFDEKRSNYI